MLITITKFDGNEVTTQQTLFTDVVDAVDSIKQTASSEYDTVRVAALGPCSADVWAYNTPGTEWDGTIYAVQAS